MRAAVVRTPGPDASVEVIEVATPEPAPHEIRIAVEGATVNPVDLMVVSGFFHSIGWIDQPEHTGLGWDIAGRITAVGADAAREHPELAVGTRVAALHEGLDHATGPYADQVLVPAEAAVVVPEELDLVAAATVPMNSLTADQALDLLGEADGRTLLVTGAAGAVGEYAVRLAVLAGWEVVGLARESDRDAVADAGARPIASVDEVSSVDAAFDAAALVDPVLAVVRDGGHYVGVVPANVPASVRGITTAAVKVHADRARQQRLLDLTVAGTLPTRVHATVPLADVAVALDKVAAGGVRGRYVLVP
ncbi:NADP-dependent oxidoreductase [Luteipulveratus mongoliensis]|uniref:Enoyl reductase (ER) domain-containing protein n=1 Tax=Luteipulveratus mongoliensis TaxID=571913 RepID=A0A0K1JH41_9MICO|nr:NADP-dependent oxidoreductase [Luteipulveratus mongoliensis]AKU16029.1 hypothetical protein VV02_09445 [Luteipulveratus mongoliensis]